MSEEDQDVYRIVPTLFGTFTIFAESPAMKWSTEYIHEARGGTSFGRRYGTSMGTL